MFGFALVWSGEAVQVFLGVLGRDRAGFGVAPARGAGPAGTALGFPSVQPACPHLLSLRPSLPAATNPSEPRTLPCQPFAARGRPSRGNRVLWPLSLTCIACLLGAFWASFAFAPLLGVVRVPHHVVSASPGPAGGVPGAWRAQESRQTPLSLFGN